jgi:hypothetical protein
VQAVPGGFRRDFGRGKVTFSCTLHSSPESTTTDGKTNAAFAEIKPCSGA